MKPRVVSTADRPKLRVLTFVGLKPSSLPQSEIDAFVERFVLKTPRTPEPPDAA